MEILARMHTSSESLEKLSGVLLESEGISAEVVDIRTVPPLDRRRILESVVKTGRLAVVGPVPRMCGVAAEVAAMVAQDVFDCLKGAMRLTDVPVPFSPEIERKMYPTAQTIAAAAVELCNRTACARFEDNKFKLTRSLRESRV